jgi:metal-responsive CopG/Arc/MetJ family transcriptional regulator
MRTTIAIDEELIAELMRIEPHVTRSEAMRKAIEDYVRRKRVDEFIGLAGSGLVDMDWQESERRELTKLKKHGRKR